MQAYPRATSYDPQKPDTSNSSREREAKDLGSNTNSQKGSSRPPGLPPVKCTTAVMDEGPRFLFELANAPPEKIVFSVSNVRFIPPILFDRLPGHLLTIDGPFSAEQGDGILIRSGTFEHTAQLVSDISASDDATVEFALLEDKLHHVFVLDPALLNNAIAGYATSIEE